MSVTGTGCVLGVDGGGSKTLALVADRAGRPLDRGEAGPSNYQGVGLTTALAALETAVAALADADRPRSDLVAACVGLAGVDRLPTGSDWRPGQRAI